MSESPAVADNEAESRTQARSGIPMRLGMFLGGAWLAFLLFLTFTAANPVTLNLVQIRNADLVVVARVLDLDAERCQPVETLSGPAPEQVFLVRRLAESGAAQDGEYLFALRLTAGLKYDIAPAPDGSRPIYPAGPAALAQYREVMKP